MGHMAEWKIPLEEINPPLSSESYGISRQEIKKLIDESLDRKLAPIMNMLADSYEDGPSLTEIISGIGYIFGLVGVAMYFTSRRKKK
jgi:nickel transport protein